MCGLSRVSVCKYCCRPWCAHTCCRLAVRLCCGAVCGWTYLLCKPKALSRALLHVWCGVVLRCLVQNDEPRNRSVCYGVSTKPLSDPFFASSSSLCVLRTLTGKTYKCVAGVSAHCSSMRPAPGRTHSRPRPCRPHISFSPAMSALYLSVGCWGVGV